MPRKYKKFLAYLFILIFPLALLFVRYPPLNTFKMKVVDAIAFPLQWLSYPIDELKKIIFYRRIYSEYQRLKKDVEVLKSRLIGQEEILRENIRFEKLLNFKRDLIFSSEFAHVIGRDPTNWSAAVIIDKGEKHGIKVGMPVVNALGVVGKIAEVGLRTSKVILLNDPGFSVAALIQRSREGGLVSGSLQGLCRMRYLSVQADVEIGDKVITSKLSSAFPEGLYIGRVVRIQTTENSPTSECWIQPAVSFSQIEEVIVIKK